MVRPLPTTVQQVVAEAVAHPVALEVREVAVRPSPTAVQQVAAFLAAAQRLVPARTEVTPKRTQTRLLPLAVEAAVGALLAKQLGLRTLWQT